MPTFQPIGKLPSVIVTQHRSTCTSPGPWVLVTMDDGKHRVQCDSCRRRTNLAGLWLAEVLEENADLADDYRDVSTEGSPAPAPVIVGAEVAQPVARWWCREHNLPVSWRGTGCPGCQREHDERMASREAARRARAAAREAA